MNALNMTEQQRRDADSHGTSPEIWMACCKVAEEDGVDVEQVWSDPNILQGNRVLGYVRDFIRSGLAEDGHFNWGVSVVMVTTKNNPYDGEGDDIWEHNSDQ